MEQGLNEAVNIRHINRSIKGYKDKYFKETMSLNNCTNEIKLRWFYIRLKRVVKGRHWHLCDITGNTWETFFQVVGKKYVSDMPISLIYRNRQERLKYLRSLLK